MKIITEQLAKKLPRKHVLRLNKIVNPQDYLSIYAIIKGAQELTIYDITKTKKHPPESIISVRDHINRTGKNPLIGKQKTFDIDFINITNLYQSKKNSVYTNCCGKELNRKYQYPSHYLCNISILARAIKIQKIIAFLVNKP